jgi:hypothetical protein
MRRVAKATAGWMRRIGLLALWLGAAAVVLGGAGLLLSELVGSVVGAAANAAEGDANAGAGLVWAAWVIVMVIVASGLAIGALLMSRGLFTVGIANVALGVMLVMHSSHRLPIGVDVGPAERMAGLAFVAIGLTGVVIDAWAASLRRKRAS